MLSLTFDLCRQGDIFPELSQEADRVSVGPQEQHVNDVTGSGHQRRGLFQIADIIDENEGHFLSSLRRGSRLIQRTCLQTDGGHFPGPPLPRCA